MIALSCTIRIILFKNSSLVLNFINHFSILFKTCFWFIKISIDVQIFSINPQIVSLTCRRESPNLFIYLDKILIQLTSHHFCMRVSCFLSNCRIWSLLQIPATVDLRNWENMQQFMADLIRNEKMIAPCLCMR